MPGDTNPKSLREVVEKRNDFLRSMASSDKAASSLILPHKSDDGWRELVSFGVEVLTWVLGEEHKPQKLWNTDARIPVGTWRSYEEPQDPEGLRVIPG